MPSLSPAADQTSGPYIELSREAWAALAADKCVALDDETLRRLRGKGDPTSMQDVVDVYVPLCELIHLYARHTGELYDDSNAFLGMHPRRTPFVIAIAGSVAVGKSTTARLIRELLRAHWSKPRVDLITTDGFLYPNAELERRGILDRKGFPESYDRRALQRFVVEVKSGAPRVVSPVYSHTIYDIVPGEQIVVESPDILIVEGLNVLQPSRPRADGTSGLSLADFFDFSVYVDANPADVRRWYIDRFLQLRQTAFRDPDSYFRRFVELDDAEAVELAGTIWDEINGPNLVKNVRPTAPRATAILRKGPDHTVQRVRIRKL